jgi:hypothetical protein
MRPIASDFDGAPIGVRIACPLSLENIARYATLSRFAEFYWFESRILSGRR